MSYTMAEVDAAEARIKRECPKARTERSNYDFTLAAINSDNTKAYIVFDAGPDMRDVIGDVDQIIHLLNTP